MHFLKERILNDGVVGEGGVLQVGGFLNHMVDVNLLRRIGHEFAEVFRNQMPTKIITIEASGIPIAMVCALELNVPFVIAKKYASINLTDNVYSTEVFSFTKQKTFSISVSKDVLKATDRVLILDDFLAYGHAVNGLIDIVSVSQAFLVGVGVCVEKSYLDGGESVRSKGIKLHSMVIVSSLSNGTIIFGDRAEERRC